MGLEKSTLDQLRIDRTTAPPRTVPWVFLIILVILLGLGLGAWWRFGSKIPTVETVTVREIGGADPKTQLNASGYVVARREATVSSKVTGKVIEVLVEEGMRVEQGQILARLDTSNTKSSLDLAEAQLVSAKALLEETKVRLHDADLELRRIAGLATNQVSSQSDLDHASAAFHSLKAHLEQQQADVLVAERQVALWRQQMDDCLIRAPFSGIVVSKNAQPGEMISPISAGGGFTRTGICTIVDMESLEIEIDVSESYLNRVQPSQSVLATLDAYSNWRIPCKVKAIIPTADRQKATVKVRVTFEKLDPRILPEMGVKVVFQGAPEKVPASAGVLISKSALRKQDGRDIVFLSRNGQVERRAVKLGNDQGDDVVVLAGLNAGDRVISKGPESLKEGDRIQETRP